MIWTVLFTVKAEKDLDTLPPEITKKIISKLEEMAQGNPYEHLDKMTNSPFYKFRVGAYRAIVNIINNKMILQLVKAKHRPQDYKK